jgi:hypothetical protein
MQKAFNISPILLLLTLITLNSSHFIVAAAAGKDSPVDREALNAVKRAIDAGTQQGFDEVLFYVPDIVPLNTITPRTVYKLVNYAFELKKLDESNAFKRHIFAYLSNLYTTNLVNPSSLVTVQDAQNAARQGLKQDLAEMSRSEQSRGHHQQHSGAAHHRPPSREREYQHAAAAASPAHRSPLPARAAAR